MAEERHALVVATSKYLDQRLPPLNAPSQDAAALRRVLGSGDIGAFEVKVSLNARIQALRKTLEAFFARRDRDDLLLVHFSCHGLKDDAGQLYLAAADTEVDLLKATALDADWLRQLMNDCRSQRIAIFLDCCFGGAFAAGMIHKVGVDTPGINEHLQGSGRVVITASNAVQYAFESGNRVGDPEPSVFTRALVDGLKSGEADRNQDGVVTINELFDFLADKVRETSPSQTPTKWEFNADGDWVIAHSEHTPSVSLGRLPGDLQTLIASPDTLHRLAALVELRTLAASRDPMMTASARLAIAQLATDDSQRVSSGAKKLLAELGPASGDADGEVGDGVQGQAEADAAKAAALAAEAEAKAEADRQAEAQAAAESAAREAQAKADADAKARAQAEADAKAKAAADHLAQQEAEADQRRREQADAARLARDQAEAERLAREAAERAAAAAAAEAARREEQRRERRRRTIGVGAAAAAIALFAGVGFAAMGCLGRCGPGGSPLPSAGRSAVVPSTAIPSGPVEPSTGPPSQPADGPILPDSRILYTSQRGKVADIRIAAPDGTGDHPLISGVVGDQVWSPSGEELIYRTASGLAIAPKAGKPKAPFTGDGDDRNPAWSTKDMIAFSSGPSDKLQLYTLARDDPGGNATHIASSNARDWDPSWSPDSAKFAFVSTRRDGTKAVGQQIWIVDLASPDDPTRLTTDNGIYDDPAWSPTNEWIAVTRATTVGGTKTLWLIHPDGTGLKQVKTGSGSVNDPAWSRDGAYLAFARGGNTRTIVVIDREGDVKHEFGPSGVLNGLPDWH